jgi:signal transduction histidine kinase/DNA-binding NarL/FixJ family response regulator
MKTLLVIAVHPELCDAVRAAVDGEKYRVILRASLEEAEPLLANGLAHACIIDAELTSVQGVWLIEKIHRRAPKCPIIVYTASRQWEWEEEAYLQGVSHVLAKPVRGRLLNEILHRIFSPSSADPGAAISLLPVPMARSFPPEVIRAPEPPASLASPPQTLSLLRDFSGILTHSLDAEAMLRQFLLMLREIVSINRAVIFMRPPPPSFAEGPGQESRRLRAVGSLGIATGLLEHFELSLEAGIGAQLLRLGRILKLQSEEARLDPETRKEFELLGGQVAVPIMDREHLLGVAVFDGRITGESLINSELELIYRLLEQLGLAVKNIWLHGQLSSNHEMMAGILRELSCACVVVSRDLTVLHANKMARKYFGSKERQGEVEFSDLPQMLGAKVYQVLRTGAAVAAFKYQPEDEPGTIYNINIVPFQKAQAGLPASALLMAEDLSQSQQLQRLEIEAANLRLVKAMADRLTHEIGNAMVPLSTHQQLLSDKWKDPEFRASLDAALADGVKRVTRLINQMRFLARDILVSQDAFPLGPLLDEAFQEARKYQPVKTAQLKYETGSAPIVLTGDRAALKHALAEVMLNALQANPTDPKIGVRFQSSATANGRHGLQIEVQDNGSGFTPEAAIQAPAPFFTTRNIGLGLGLTVSRKIIETHHGKLEIVSPHSGQAGVVRISLPIEQSLSLQT